MTLTVVKREAKILAADFFAMPVTVEESKPPDNNTTIDLFLRFIRFYLIFKYL